MMLSEEAKWDGYFNRESEKATAIKTQVAATDREIDQLVVALYELTEEEMEVVEG